MILTVFAAVALSAVYGYLMVRQIKFVRGARAVARTADRAIPGDWGGTVITALSYASIASLALNVVLILCARRRAVVVRRLPT